MVYPARFARQVFACVFAVAMAGAGRPSCGQEDLHAQWRAIHADALRQIDQLAEQQDDPQLAAQIRRARIQRVRSKQLYFLPPRLRSSAHSLTHSIQTASVRAELGAIHAAQAGRLWQLAKQLAAGDPTSALRLAHEVVYLDPDHEPARHLVEAGAAGEDEPVPVVAKSRHKVYDWPAGSYWRVKTDHFLIVINHSRQAAARAARVVEETQAVWRQLFAPLWLTEANLRRVLDGARLPRRRRKHKVVVFADRAEYLQHLKRVEPQVALSTGMYRDVEATSYFYMDDPVHLATWHHELTHQLFQEVLQAEPGVGSHGGFWAVEAIALYMESARRCSTGFYQLGGIDARRLQYARYRALNEQCYLPLAELAALSKDSLQAHPEIRKLYSQSAGLAHFLMDGPNLEYRSAFIQSLGELYRSDKRARTLGELLDEPLSTLDHGYHDFLRVSDEDLASLAGDGCAAAPAVTLLLLGHTQVTDAGVGYLRQLRRLEWLDLTACNVTDDAVARLPADLDLERLTLEGTAVSDRTCRLLAKFPQLTELDLSHTAITDRGAMALAHLHKLRSLWLTGTAVTDEGLAALAGLEELTNLNVDDTGVTDEGWQQLQKALPRLGKSPAQLQR